MRDFSFSSESVSKMAPTFNSSHSVVDEACKGLNIARNTRFKDCPGCKKKGQLKMRGITICNYHYLALKELLYTYYRFESKEAKRLTAKQIQSIRHGRQKHLRWKFDCMEIGDLLLRFHNVMLDKLEKKKEDNYKHFVHHGILDVNFSIDELENMRVGKSPDDFLYWNTCHTRRASVTMPFGCIFRQFSLDHFSLLFTDGTYFVLGRNESSSYYLDFVHWWKENIIKWRELAKSFHAAQLKLVSLPDNASLPDNNVDFTGDNGSSAGESRLEK